MYFYTFIDLKGIPQKFTLKIFRLDFSSQCPAGCHLESKNTPCCHFSVHNNIPAPVCQSTNYRECEHVLPVQHSPSALGTREPLHAVHRVCSFTTSQLVQSSMMSPQAESTSVQSKRLVLPQVCIHTSNEHWYKVKDQSCLACMEVVNIGIK